MSNIAARVKSIFGLRLFVVLFLLVLSWLTGYQIGFREKLENAPPVVKENDQLLGLSVKAPEKPSHKLKEIGYEEISPDNLQKAIEYKMSFDPQLYDDYYNDFFLNQKIISVKNIRTDKEDYVFTGEDRTGDPHWLGNDKIFFTTYCGTACQGLYLVDTGNKESELAVISYVFDGDGPWMTHFKDWFGEEFLFKGLVDEITSMTAGDKSYLIFKMKDVNKNPLAEERFLFMGKSLIRL